MPHLQPAVNGQPPRMALAPLPRRTVHLDFHVGPGIPDVGAAFNPGAFAESFAAAKVESVTLFAKCHHGHLYYDSDRPERHPGLPRSLNLLDQQVEALHARGIKAPIYLSMGVDEYAAGTHPEWIALEPGGRQVKRYGGRFDAGWYVLDMDSPYQEYFSAQLTEVLEHFGTVDGIFLDMCWDQPSASVWAVAAMRADGLDPASPADRDRHARTVARRYMARFRELVLPRLAPDAAMAIWYNSRPKTVLSDELAFVDHVEIEALPTGGWGYSYLPYVARFVRPLGVPALAHTGRFHKSWGDSGGLKSPASLKYECAQMITRGLTACVGDLLPPDGRPAPAAYRLIGGAYEYLQRCEPFVAGGEHQVEAAVLVDPAHGDSPGPSGVGLVRALQRHRVQFDVLAPDAPLGGYQLVIVPELTVIDPGLGARLKTYLEAGGALIVSGAACLDAAGAPALPELGIADAAPSPFTHTFLRQTGTPDAFPHAMYEPVLTLTPQPDAEVLYETVEPYFERAWDHFSGHDYTPADVRPLVPGGSGAAVILHGRTGTFAAPIFAAIGRNAAAAYQDALRAVLGRLLPDPLLRADGPAHLETAVVDTPASRVVHLLSFVASRQAEGVSPITGQTEGIDLVDDPFPLVDVPVSVRSAAAPSRVTLQPHGIPLAWEHRDGRVHATVTIADGHGMIVIEYLFVLVREGHNVVSRRTPLRFTAARIASAGAGQLRRRLAQLLSLVLIGSALTTIAAIAPPRAHAATMRMVVNASHPLLLLQLVAGANLSDDPSFRNDINKEGWDIAEAWSNIPDDIKPYVAFVLHPGHNSLWTTAQAQSWMTANVAEAQTLNIPVLALWGETPTEGSAGLSYVQTLYEDYPNFIGTAVSEETGYDGDIPSLLALANEYGGYHVQSSIEQGDVLGTKLQNSTFYSEVTADAANFIYAPKNIHDNFDAVTGQAEGDWLAGVAGNWGPYFDGYAYYGCGIYGETSNGGGDRCSRSEPEEAWGQTMLDDYMAGATVYHFENQTDAPGFENQYTPAFWQSILPAFRYIIAHPAPSAAQVIANTKVAFSEADGSIYSLDDTDNTGSLPRTTFYEGLSENPTDALVTQGLWYYPRGSGRYYFIPVLPELAPSSVVSEFPDVVTATSYNSSLLGLNSKLSYFNNLYPQLYSGDAFVQNIGTQWLVYNTHYADDTSESADIPLSNGSTWSDIDFPTVNPDSMAMINDNSTSLGILLDNYTTNRASDLLSVGGYRMMEYIDSFNQYAYTAHPSDTTLRTDVIRVRTTSQPTLTISGYDAHYTYTQEWNPNTDIYTLTVNHNGVVQITLDHSATDSATEGWSRTDDTSSAITYGGSWAAETGVTGDYDSTYHVSTAAGATISYEFNGTSIEWLANTVSGGGTASVSIDGTLFASGVSLNSSSPANGAVIWRTTGLTNQPHTITITATSGDIGLDRFAYQPSQLWMVNAIDEQNFSYGTAASAEGYLQGSDHWVITGGQMKILPYVAPWSSDVSVYNTNGTYTDSAGFTDSATVTSVKGTPGGLLFDASPTAKTGYYFYIDPTSALGNTEVALVKISGSSLTLLADDSAASISMNTPYALSVTVSGSSITGYLNGTQVVSATDSSYTSGYTGVRVQNNVGGVGDFVDVASPTVTVGGATSYTSAFGSWSAASGWVTEGALNFKSDWPTVTSFDQPWNWAQAGGTWSVVNNDAIETSGRNGIYQGVAGSSGTSTALAGSTSWEDYRYSSLLEFPSSGTTGIGGLVFRAKDASDYYELYVTRTSISLVKDVAGTLTTLATASDAFSRGDWYALAVTADGDMLSATVNGVQVLSATDSTYRTGEVGYAAGAGYTVDFDDATIMQLPTAGTGSTPPAAVTVDPVTTAAIAGYVPVIAKTPLGTAPTLPSTVTAYYSNGTTGSVAVTWPTPTAAQLATADTPSAAGASAGNFTLTGTVSGASVSPTAQVEVQPVLASTLASSVTVTSGETDYLPLSYTGVSFNAGSLTYSRTVYIIWDTVPNTSTMTAGQSVTVQGTIEGYPYATATATVTLS